MSGHETEVVKPAIAPRHRSVNAGAFTLWIGGVEQTSDGKLAMGDAA